MEVIILIVVVVVIVGIVNGNKAEKEKEKARQAYISSLEKLKENPTNPNLKQRTLQLGRDYSNLTRNKEGVALFDEVALMNDINAACAAASISGLSHGVSSSSTIQEKISTLTSLYEQGVIDEAEFQQRKKQILDNL
jgi:hypothetical protein